MVKGMLKVDRIRASLDFWIKEEESWNTVNEHCLEKHGVTNDSALIYAQRAREKQNGLRNLLLMIQDRGAYVNLSRKPKKVT